MNIAIHHESNLFQIWCLDMLNSEYSSRKMIGVKMLLHVLALTLILGIFTIALTAASSSITTAAAADRKAIYPEGISPDNRIISDFHSWIGVNGKRRKNIHQGIDIAGPHGQEIIAIADGRVIETHVEKCWGPTVVIDHGKDVNGKPLIAAYGHVYFIVVLKGDEIYRGDVIAHLGNNHHNYKCISGVKHLHLQLGREWRELKDSYWGHAYFLRDSFNSLNPHLLWANGPYKITCFDKKKSFRPGTITYPIPCEK